MSGARPRGGDAPNRSAISAPQPPSSMPGAVAAGERDRSTRMQRDQLVHAAPRRRPQRRAHAHVLECAEAEEVRRSTRGLSRIASGWPTRVSTSEHEPRVGDARALRTARSRRRSACRDSRRRRRARRRGRRSDAQADQHRARSVPTARASEGVPHADFERVGRSPRSATGSTTADRSRRTRAG